MTETQIRDVNDCPILRAAIEAKADVLLTGDKDFLESGVKNPAIMTPAEFLNTYLTQGQRAESEKLPARCAYICCISFLSIRVILSLMVSVLVLLKWTRTL